MKLYELSLCSKRYLNFGNGFPLRVFTAGATSVSSNRSTAHSGSISLQDDGVVTKISSCRVNTTSRRGIKRLGISFGSIFQ